MKLILAVAAVSATFSVNTLAQTERDLDSHVHGAASLNVAVSDSSVFIELNSPWNNLVGFEHTPNTDDQQLLVDNALQQLNAPTELFAFNAGECALIETTVESAMTDEHHEDEHEEKDEHEHEEEHEAEHEEKDEHEHEEEHEAEHEEKDEHEEHHDHEDADKHDDEDHDEDHDDKHDDHDDHADDADDSDTHTSVLAIYSYECQQIDNLSSIDTTALFSLWPGFKDLDVQLIGDNGQTLIELDPSNTVIDISQVQ